MRAAWAATRATRTAPSARSILAMTWLFGIALPDSYSLITCGCMLSCVASCFCVRPLALRACVMARRKSLDTVWSARAERPHRAAAAHGRARTPRVVSRAERGAWAPPHVAGLFQELGEKHGAASGRGCGVVQLVRRRRARLSSSVSFSSCAALMPDDVPAPPGRFTACVPGFAPPPPPPPGRLEKETVSQSCARGTGGRR